MTDTTITGLVATTPRHLITADGLPITSFRLVSASQKFDSDTGTWVEGEQSWFTIVSFKNLAINVAGSVSKGERVVVSGKLSVRDWDNGERAGTSVELQATSLGHDLNYGTASFTRTSLSGLGLTSPTPNPTISTDEESLIEIG